jgi:glutamate formiminotransferase
MRTPEYVKLVECVTNFSEGRRGDVISSIYDAIAGVNGVYMLGVSSDVDHNRTVITFAAPPQVITEAAYRGIETASRLIDLDQHRGVHPRIGATDVVPLIPLRDVTMPECVTIAHDLGRRVGEELGIPVYFYEYAATRPDRRNLADVRRQPYEQLKQTIKSDADRKPDYGPARLGKVGATAIGAREPLIAFNAFLNTDNVEIAVKIAEAVRESGGGLPYLKALGLLVEGKAQVSMNVIDFRRTSLYTIWERVKLEASKHGVLITHTEIVGLIPQAALIDAALSYLQLPIDSRDLILEQRLGLATDDFREIKFE